MIFLAQEGCGVLQTTGRCRFSPGFRSLGPGRCPGSCPRESLSLVVAHGNPKAKTRAPTSWCSSAVAAGTSLDPKGARDGHGGPKGDGWWWNDAGISEAAVLMYRCQDIVNHLPPQKKRTQTTIVLTARWKVLFRHGRFWFDHQTRGAIEARLSDRCHGSYGSVWSIRLSGDVRLECRLAVKLGTVFERNVWDCLGFVAPKHIEHKLIAHKVKRSIKRNI